MLGVTTQRIDGKLKVVPGAGGLKPLAGPMPPDFPSLIWIPAVPSSGTSVVAGLLERLGVNMGVTRGEQNRGRGYQMHECLEVGLFTFMQQSPLDHLLNQRVRLRDYAQYRFYKAEQEGDKRPQGVKALSTAWAYDLDPATLPVKIIDVYRPLEESIAADLRRVVSRPGRVSGESPREPFQHWNRAGGVAACWEAKLMLFDIHKPLVTLAFSEVLRDPERAIDKLCEVLELTPTDRQRRQAELFVERKD